MNSNQPVIIRPFQDGDADAIIDLITQCYAEYGQKIELDTLDDDLLRIGQVYVEPRHTFQVMVDEDKIIGTVAVKTTAEGEVDLKRVFLNSDYRGRGLGKALSNWAIDWARRRGFRTMHIWSDVLYETAHHLYRGLGAEDTGERRSLGGINHVDEYYFRLDLGL